MKIFSRKEGRSTFDRLSSRTIGFLFSLILVLMGFGALKEGGREMFHAVQSWSWPTANGVISLSTISERENDEGGTTYKADVRYRFQVDGRSFRGDTLAFGCFGAPRAFAVKDSGQYTKGEEVSVYYDPSNPNISVLDPGVHASTWLMFSMFLLLGLALVGVGGVMGYQCVFRPQAIWKETPISWEAERDSVLSSLEEVPREYRLIHSDRNSFKIENVSEDSLLGQLAVVAFFFIPTCLLVLDYLETPQPLFGDETSPGIWIGILVIIQAFMVASILDERLNGVKTRYLFDEGSLIKEKRDFLSKVLKQQFSLNREEISRMLLGWEEVNEGDQLFLYIWTTQKDPQKLTLRPEPLGWLANVIAKWAGLEESQGEYDNRMKRWTVSWEKKINNCLSQT